MNLRRLSDSTSGTWRLRLAAALWTLCLISSSGRADWFDDFDGNQLHDPPLGSWDSTGYDLDFQEISGWQPSLENERAIIPSPYSRPQATPILLGASWVESSTDDAHRYRNSRIAGTAAAFDNGGLGNNNLIGLLARLNDFDTYVVAVNHDNGTLNLIKSRTVDGGNPFYMEVAAIPGYSLHNPYYLTLDVLDVPGGTKLTGRLYEDRSRSNLLNTIFAFDDDGEGVPGPTLRPDHSGYFAQVNAAAAQPLPVDAYFDDVWAVELRPGDVTLDAIIDRKDAAQFARNFGKITDATWDDGDMDGDGQVDLRDLVLIQQHLHASGASPAAAGSAAVPEPSSLALAAGGLCAAGLAARKRKSSCRARQ